MNATMRRHHAKTNDNYVALINSGNVFVMPKFKHLMMDNSLIMVEIPEDYYRINREAIDGMVSNTKKFIQNLNER